MTVDDVNVEPTGNSFWGGQYVSLGLASVWLALKTTYMIQETY